MLTIGDRAPDFEAEDDTGAKVRSQDLLADGPLVLYFYPRDFTPICTREACLFRDVQRNAASLGVYADLVPVFYQRNGSAVECFGSDVPDDKTVGAAAEAPVGDQGDVRRKIPAIESARG